MKRMKRVSAAIGFVALLMLVMLVPWAFGQCRGGSCWGRIVTSPDATSRRVEASEPTPTYWMRTVPHATGMTIIETEEAATARPSPFRDQIDVYRGSRFVGAYRPSTQTYRPYLADVDGWGEPVPCPVAFVGDASPASALPATKETPPRAVGQAVEQATVAEPKPLFGVDADRVHADREKAIYRLQGEATSKARAYEAVTQGLPEDRNKLRLTLVGPKDARAKAEADLYAKADGDAKELLDRISVWSVDDDHWSAKDTQTGERLYAQGSPAVYLQAPDGEVLYREADYKPGDYTAIRKAAKEYDARKDPGRRGSPTDASGAGGLLAAAAALALAWLGRR